MKILVLSALAAITILSTGCSMHNPFGIGYDESVCNDSKTFGVCGSPSDIYKYRDIIKSVQSDYLKARLDTVLYFAVSPEGDIQVKGDRDGQWEDYNSSDWKKIINSRILKKKVSNKREASFSISNDIPVTKGGDLSIKYKKQGPLLVTRTKIGNIIRDQGLIQEVFVANYVDNENDLITSHNVQIVVRNPDWVVGERNPKNVKLENIPTPISDKMLKRQQVIDKGQEKTISDFNRNIDEGYQSALNEEQKNKKTKNKKIDKSLDIINSFLGEK